MPKDNHSPSTTQSNALKRYHVQVSVVNATVPTEPYNTKGAYGVQDLNSTQVVYDKFRIGYVIQVNSLLLVQLNGILRHVINLRLFMGSNPSSGHNCDLE